MWILSFRLPWWLSRRIYVIPLQTMALLKSYHSHLNEEFYVKDPNIYVFVVVLKKIQQSVRFNEQHVRAGAKSE